MSIQLHAGQAEVYAALFMDMQHRFAAVCCARGWGKSFMAGVAAVTACFELMALPERTPNKRVYIIAPTYDQVTDIYYPLLNYELGLEHFAIKSSRDEGRFVLPGNVELRLMSYEAIERMRGKGAYLVVWDEISSCTKGISQKEAWEGIIQPCIITRWSEARAKLLGARSPGRALVITTPKGYNFFYDMYNYRDADPAWCSFHFDYTQSPLIDKDEVERIKHNIDPVEFASEYLATFTDSGNSVFYCFDRNVHVRRDLPYFEEGEDVHAFIDFNVGIQATSFGAVRGKHFHILDEFMGHPDTETLAIAIKAKFPGRRIFAYPDPTGRSRKTSAPIGTTDFTILQAAGITCLARQKSPPIVDSVAAVNRMLKTASGDISMYVSARCQGVAASLERTSWLDRNPDTATIDKTEGVEHYSDGVRYGIEYMFPVKRIMKPTVRGFNF